MGSPTTLVSLERVHKVYLDGSMPVHALHSIDLQVGEGEFLMVTGPSGCGKSSLLNVIAGVDLPTAGRVSFRGRSLASMSDRELSLLRRRSLGFMFQDFNLLDMTAGENVELPMVIARVPKRPRKEEVRHLLAAVGLEDRADHRPSTLSGGEKQRVALARALANDPEVLLLDEPTGNLDRRGGDELMELLSRVRRARAREHTFVMVTHDNRLLAHATRIARMVDGKLAGGAAS
jgi:putative ABC transport system ATP-binding protein